VSDVLVDLVRQFADAAEGAALATDTKRGAVLCPRCNRRARSAAVVARNCAFSRARQGASGRHLSCYFK
jgi:hypothetical protein